MKKIAIFCIVACFFSYPAVAAEKTPEKVVNLANHELLALGEDPVIVAAVSAENAKKKTLEQITKTDTDWKNTPGITPFMKQLLENTCSTHLQSLQKSRPFIAEIFVMDNLGANVAMTNKTSDYWQGDEAKFQKSFNNGEGTVFIDEVEFDESAQTYLVQVSVPVKSHGKTIGAITFGIELDQLEK